MPEVSIVIPAYNAMEYLPHTVESVLQQTFRDFEVVIVNDGSTDNIKYWFDQAVRDPRFRLISQENQGIAGARNAGIANTQGEFIAFLDADDLWHPSKLKKQVQALRNNPDVGLAYTWLQYTDEHAIPTGRVVTSSFQGDVWKQLTAFNFVGCGSNAMVRRTCFKAVGNFDHSLGSYVEDWDMWLRIAKHSPFAVIKEPLVYNRKHADSCSTHWQKMEESYTKVIEKAFTAAPPQLLTLKRRSYSHASLCLAWKVLQGKQKNYKTALSFWQKAFSTNPKILFFSSFINMGVLLLLLGCFGLNRYDTIQGIIVSMRQGFSATRSQ
ncbi:MAG: glycosyltransferase family A protein [Cyanobacteria bacterium J06634_5]